MAKGVEPVRKLSCQMLGGMVVMAPPAWTWIWCRPANPVGRGVPGRRVGPVAGLRIDDELLRDPERRRRTRSRRCAWRAR